MRVPNGVLAGRSILIVEDEPLIALDIHAAFSAAGASIVAALDSREALRLTGLPDLSAAVVDIGLGAEDCCRVCKRLSDNGVPFVFYTGEARTEVLRQWPNAPVLTKLAGTKRVVEVVAGVLR